VFRHTGTRNPTVKATRMQPIHIFKTPAHSRTYALCVGLAWASAILSQAATAQPLEAANPTAKVPAAPYRSVFKETSLGVEKDTDNWRKANDEVGKFTRGHVDILKWEEQEAAKATKEPTGTPLAQPAAPKAAMPAPASSMPAAQNAPEPIAAPVHKH
jgi:hypothetical protein